MKRTVVIVEQRNGDVFEKFVVRHEDGRCSVRRKKIACGIPAIRSLPRGKKIAAQHVASQSLLAEAQRRPTYKTRIPHESDGAPTSGEFVKSMKPAYVETTNDLPRVLKKAKVRIGDHIEQFQKDFEILEAGLSSPNLGGVRGGSAMPIPMAQVQAQDRLKEFEAHHPDAFLVCKLVIVDSVALRKLPVPSKYRRDGGRERLLQESVDRLAEFYQPKKMRPDRGLAAFARKVEEDKRRL